jgi:hypothetical protein
LRRNLFSTLLGFTLQSFSPLRESKDSYEFLFSVPALSSKTCLGFGPALQRLDPLQEAVLLFAPQKFLGRRLVLS